MSSSIGRRPLASIAWPAVLVTAGLMVVALLILSPAYGWHRDELYFVAAGRHPAFGYVDQPPLTPLLSAGAVALLGASPTAVRILPALAVGTIVVLAALMARDLGGGRKAQVVAAVTAALSGLLAAGHLSSTSTYDLLAWAVVLWLTVRLLAGGDARLWLLVGLAAGIGLQNKHLVLFLGAGLAAGILLARRWDVVRSPWAWGAVAIAVALWLPNLLWQAANGFPQLEMAAAIADRDDGGVATTFVELILLAGPLLFPVSIAGWAWLLASPQARPWRALGWAPLVVLALMLLMGGKSYYVAGFLPLLMAAGATVVERWLERGRGLLRPAAFGLVAAASGVLLAVLVLPLVPAAGLAGTPIPDIYGEAGEQLGWPELVATVEGVVADLPAEDRGRAVIVTENYGEAGALEVLGRGLPPVHSGHNAYWDWGPPTDDRTVVVVVGMEPGRANAAFEGCRAVAAIDNDAGVENEEQGRPVLVCGAPREPWADTWPGLRHLD